ncbi:MAG: MATE family efflux transporter [Ruthenibacterium sp.]
MTIEKLDYSRKTLFKMSWPIFIELLLQLLVGNMDQIQLSHFNATGVAATGNANQIITIVLLLFNVISLAAMILISQYRGANDMKKVNQIYTLSLTLNLLLSCVMAGVLIFAGDSLLSMMRVPAELIPEAHLYLVISASALPFNALMLTFSAFLRANAQMKPIMVITGFVNVCNIAGNAILINGVGPFPRLGVAGAALSSSIFRFVGFLLMMLVFFRRTPDAKIAPALLRPFPKNLLRRLLAIGLPSGGENLSYNLSQISCLVFVNLMGTVVVTTRMYAGMIAVCIYMLISAVSQAGQILVGYLVGARDFDGANRCTMRILFMFTPITVGISALVAIFAKPIFGLLTDDVRIIALGQTIFIIEIFLEIGRSLNIVLVRNLQAVGDVKFPVFIGILSQWVIAVGGGYLLGVVCGFGLAGLWVAFAIDENVRGILFFIRWKRGKWRKIKTI